MPIRRSILFVLLSFIFVSLPHEGRSGADDHGDLRLWISITNLSADPYFADKTALGLEIENEGQADLILRSVKTNFGDATFFRKIEVFGAPVINPIARIAVPGKNITEIALPGTWISIDTPYLPSKSYALGLDFGPMGMTFFEAGGE